MDKRNDGGRAFPVPNDANNNGDMGITVRQYYAAAALQGILAGVANHDMAAAMAEGTKGGRIEAAAAFAWADAMIAEESK